MTPDSLPQNKMCIIFLPPVDCTGPKKITEKAKESFWSRFASDIEKNNVKFKDLAPECGICREDTTVLLFDHQIQNNQGETHRGGSLPYQHRDLLPSLQNCIVHPICGHYFHGLYMPSNKPDMDIIPHTLNNGGITADYCDECAINNTIDELTDNLHNLLPEESKGRYAVPLAYGGGGMPKGCSPCDIVGLLNLFDRELSNSPDIAEELKGEYLGIGIKLSNSDEYCSRDVTGPVLEIEPPAAIKQLINDIVDSTIESQRENGVWLEADFSSMKIRVLHFKPELLSQAEESPVEQETVPQDEN
ncbi:hypothetical protein DER46DRAFT_660600 [Fusarium sp. MPI-SDFR-AT-0072]|nr:hypothetical protein DER46DRAFT_660600 [Fusarium sp. MPI-SDFR-AT-0072]